MEPYSFLPIVGFAMLAMTAGVSYDANERNKYATPWFLLVSLIGIFGVLFYYITVRTEEDTPLGSPSTLTTVGVVLLTVLGAFCGFAGLVGIAGGGGIVVSLYGFPAIAIAFLLYMELRHDSLKKQRTFAEYLYIFVVGAFVSLIVLGSGVVESIVGYTGATVLLIITTVAFPVGWYLFNRRSKTAV